jgi:hypothetical protein
MGYMNAIYATLVLIRYCFLLLHVSVPLNHHQALPIQFYEHYYIHNGSVIVVGLITFSICFIDLML